MLLTMPAATPVACTEATGAGDETLADDRKRSREYDDEGDEDEEEDKETAARIAALKAGTAIKMPKIVKQQIAAAAQDLVTQPGQHMTW